MSSESVCHVARSWVDVGSFRTRLFEVVYFAIASVREFLDTPSYNDSRAVSSMRTDRHDESNSRFPQFCELA
jgi:hypothetical protein